MKFRTTTSAPLLLTLLALTLLLAPAAEACPTCTAGMADGGPDTQNMVAGYFWSIVFMMSMPFLIMGGLASLFYWEICKARRAAKADERQSQRERSAPPLGIPPAAEPS